jgi:outer membrane protein assembly factor BamB
VPQNAAADVATAEREAPPPFPADRNALSLRRAELSAGAIVNLRFILRNVSADAVLHVRLSSTNTPWLSLLPGEAALGPGEQQAVAVRIETAGVTAAMKANGSPNVPITLAFQYLSSGTRKDDTSGTGAVYLRLPTSICPSCHRHLEEDDTTGQIPEVCPYCFERLRVCPVCGTPNSWLARTCIQDDSHVVRATFDWPILGGDPGHRGSRPEMSRPPTLALSRRWSYPNVAPSRREQALAWSAPTAAYGLVTAAAATTEGDAHVYAFDAVTGAPLWDPFPLQAPVYPDRGGVSLSNGRLFAADVNGVVICLDALRGTRIWETRLDRAARVYGTVVPTNTGLLLVTSATADGMGCLFILETETGRIRHQIALPGPSDSTPAFADGRAFAHTDSGHLLAIDVQSGQILWSVHCIHPDDPASGTGFDSAPVIYEGQVFSASATGTIWRHAAATGEMGWNLAVTNSPLAGTPAHDGTLVYLPADDGVHLVSSQNGRAVRRYPTRLPVRSAPIVLGTTVFFGATDGVVWGAMPGRTLERLYETGTTGSQIIAAPAVSDGALFITATNGLLYALNIG